MGIHVPDEVILETRSLIRLRNTVVKDTTREKNRIKSLLYFHGIDIPPEFTKHSVGNWSKRFLQWLQSVELSTEYGKKTLDLHVEQLVRLRSTLLEQTRTIRGISREEPFKETLRLLTSISGIGMTTATTLLFEIDDIGRFANADRLASFVGLVVNRIFFVLKRGQEYVPCVVR